MLRGGDSRYTYLATDVRAGASGSRASQVPHRAIVGHRAAQRWQCTLLTADRVAALMCVSIDSRGGKFTCGMTYNHAQPLYFLVLASNHVRLYKESVHDKGKRNK